MKLLLDIKLSEALDKEHVVRLIERYDAALDVIVGVRSLSDLGAVRALNPNLRTIAFIPDAESIDSYVQAGADIIRLWPEWILKSRAEPTCRYQYIRRLIASQDALADAGSESCLVHRVHNLGKPVWVTADDAPREELEVLLRLGVNGVLTDLPELLADILAGW